MELFIEPSVSLLSPKLVLLCSSHYYYTHNSSFIAMMTKKVEIVVVEMGSLPVNDLLLSRGRRSRWSLKSDGGCCGESKAVRRVYDGMMDKVWLINRSGPFFSL